MKSTTSFLIGFFVQNSYFRDERDERNWIILVKFDKSEKKGKEK